MGGNNDQGSGPAEDDLSDFDKENIAEILRGEGDWFHADLLRLCAHADPENLERLRKAFPKIVQAYVTWRDQR